MDTMIGYVKEIIKKNSNDDEDVIVYESEVDAAFADEGKKRKIKSGKKADGKLLWLVCSLTYFSFLRYLRSCYQKENIFYGNRSACESAN